MNASANHGDVLLNDSHAFRNPIQRVASIKPQTLRNRGESVLGFLASA